MKKAFILFAGAMLLASCATMGGSSASSSTTTAGTSQQQASAVQAEPAQQGQAAGMALKNLYAQYKADGKYDYKNMNNVINTLQLVNNCQGLKTNVKDSSFWKNFASGLILGSDMLVSTSNVEQVTNSLKNVVENVDTTKMQQAASTGASAINSAASAASSISSLLSLFK